MNKSIKKPTTQDVFESIWYDYLYPNSITNGNTHWTLSQDIQDQQFLILCLELAEQLVECFAKSAELPFVFDKTLDGTILKKVNHLGELFYNLLRVQNDNAAIPGEFNPHLSSLATFKIQNFNRAQYRYEVSEYSKILYDVANKLNLKRAYFTGDPMSIIGAEALREGELINSIADRLRDAIKSKAFKTKATERKREATQSFTKSKRYIDRLHTNSPYLYGVRMFIYYRSEYASAITLEQSNNHLMKFLEPFETDSVTSSPVGWWWKREYMTEVSFRYHLIFLFDEQKEPYDPMWIDLYGRHWASITSGEGAYVIPFVHKRTHQRSGTGFFQQEYRDSLESLLSSINHMLMRDIFLRLQISKKFDHVGMGKLPKLLDGFSKSSFSTPPPDSQRYFRSNLI